MPVETGTPESVVVITLTLLPGEVGTDGFPPEVQDVKMSAGNKAAIIYAVFLPIFTINYTTSLCVNFLPTGPKANYLNIIIRKKTLIEKYIKSIFI